MRNRKNIPLFLMLISGAVTCVITYVRQYTITEKLAALLGVLVVFWILGSVLEWTLNRFEAQNEAKRQAEGEVIEKETEEADQSKATEADAKTQKQTS